MIELFKIKRYQTLLHALMFILFCGCSKEEKPMENDPDYKTFNNEEAVEIIGYGGSAMEPFISRDGKYLFFNNSGDDGSTINLHYSQKVNDRSFEYLGELPGANSSMLDGVANMDSSGNLYFTSMRNYSSSLQSLYGGVFIGDSLTNVSSIDQKMTRNQGGYVNFDSEVSKDGNTLYFATGKFTDNNFPDEADLYVAHKQNGVFEIATDSDELMKNLNTDLLEYAASISSNGLEIFFNRSNIPTLELTIWQSKRTAQDLPFEEPIQITAIQGIQTEGASISDDGKTLYYHKKHNDVFKIFKVSRD